MATASLDALISGVILKKVIAAVLTLGFVFAAMPSAQAGACPGNQKVSGGSCYNNGGNDTGQKPGSRK